MKAIVNGRLVLPGEVLENRALLYDGKILGIVAPGEIPARAERLDAQGRMVLPGLMDLHIHGYQGEDASDGSFEGLKVMAQGVAKNGVTAFLPTTMTVSYDELRRAFAQIRRAMAESRKDDWMGAAIVGAQGRGPYISHVTTGRIVDAGINDANNMGAAMAPAAYDTLCAHFADTGRAPEYYDAIFTGDLGALGHDIVQDMFAADGVKLGARYMDCGVLIYDLRTQDVHAGGSGCGCCASVLCGHILPAMRKGIWKRVLVAATGALMSPTSAQQGASIPGICHAVAIESED